MSTAIGLQGADVGALRAAAVEMNVAADQLDAGATAIDAALRAIMWLGNVASRFLGLFDGQHRPAMRSAAQFIRDGARTLSAQAAEQEAASSGGTGAIKPAWPLAPWQQKRRLDFGPFEHGRAALIEAFYATTDGRRAEPDEIEIRKLDNGRYIVVLPGVVDLSSGLSEMAPGGSNTVDRWFDRNEYNSVRDMRYAMVLAQQGAGFENPYSDVVIECMKEAGVPPGAEVMLMGHSYGAYTAIDLAADRRFNNADVGAEGFHVKVTHVLAAGAETDWRLRELPPETRALVLNNAYDAAYGAEDRLHANVSPTGDHQLEIVFRGGIKGAGHHPDLYANFLREAHDRADLNAWLSQAGDMYSSGGSAVPTKVWDPMD